MTGVKPQVSGFFHECSWICIPMIQDSITSNTNHRILTKTTKMHKYCNGRRDESGALVHPEFVAPTNIFEHLLSMNEYVFTLLKHSFSAQPLLIEMIGKAEDDPQEIGGIYALLEAMRNEVTVNNAY